MTYTQIESKVIGSILREALKERAVLALNTLKKF